jgi:integrase
LDIGTYGTINTTQDPRTGVWTARTSFRDGDGVTRPVKRSGPSRTAAERRLKAALVERSEAARRGEIKPDDRVGSAWPLYLAELRRLAKLRLLGAKEGIEETTIDLYERNWRLHLEKRVASLCWREMKTGRCHTVLTDISAQSRSSARTAKAVLSSFCRFVVIHGGLDENPVREAGTFTAPTLRPEVTLTADEFVAWLTYLNQSELAIRWDLPDINRHLMATSERISEVMANDWDDFDEESGKIHVGHRLVEVRGKGLVRKPHVKQGEQGDRDLFLPSWEVETLTRRKLEMELRGFNVSGPAPIYPNADGGWRAPGALRKVWRQVRADSPRPDTYPHMLRKAVATLLAAGGATAAEIALQLGDSEEMVRKVYNLHKPGNRRQADIIAAAVAL